ncbi:carbohydrate ABC transporter permease [Spirochaeta cellobiosiphila]|uniref:carbohydrate ABC transporter permease n=1 Tax=Spirochaeta cellobiosiphila TaxID=504483 RepID=UPI000425C06E|nr:carbohydrate ABC transporter permease [Spirochaeta cellobiosiphila]
MAKKISFYILLSLGVLIAVIPFLYMLANSLKTYSETVTRVSPFFWDPRFWPKSPQWNNFLTVFHEDNMGRYFLNSLLIGAVTVGGTLVSSSLAAYAFAKMEFPGKKIIFAVILITLMIPETVLLIPNFLTISFLGWIDKLPALTVPFMGSAFNIFLLRQFFSQIPDSLIDSAHIDGASELNVFLSIALPIMKAPLFTVAFLAFNASWMALQWPMVVTQTDRLRPITVGLAKFLSEAGPETQFRMAGALIALLPILIIYIITQKHITEAITQSGIKE